MKVASMYAALGERPDVSSETEGKAPDAAAGVPGWVVLKGFDGTDGAAGFDAGGVYERRESTWS